MDQNTLERILEGLDILESALAMNDEDRIKIYGTKSLSIVIATIRRLVEVQNDL